MEQNLAAVELRERTNTKCVAMDKYATIFVLVGRYIINSSIVQANKRTMAEIKKKEQGLEAGPPLQLKNDPFPPCGEAPTPSRHPAPGGRDSNIV